MKIILLLDGVVMNFLVLIKNGKEKEFDKIICKLLNEGRMLKIGGNIKVKLTFSYGKKNYSKKIIFRIIKVDKAMYDNKKQMKSLS